MLNPDFTGAIRKSAPLPLLTASFLLPFLGCPPTACSPRFQARREPGSPAVSFSSHLEEKQLKLVVEVQEIRSYRLSEDGNQVRD